MPTTDGSRPPAPRGAGVRERCVSWSPGDGDGLRVLAMRRWPRGVGVLPARLDAWVPDAAPSLALLGAYRAGALAWDGFAHAYLGELAAAERAGGPTTVTYYLPRPDGGARGAPSYRQDAQPAAWTLIGRPRPVARGAADALRWRYAGDPVSALRAMAALHAPEPLTLLCWEDLTRPGARCHRTLLRDVVAGTPPEVLAQLVTVEHALRLARADAEP